MNKWEQHTGHLRIHSLETDQLTEATIRQLNRKFVVLYNEDSEGFTGTRVRMTVDAGDPGDPLVRIVRSGTVESKYSFVNGRKTEGYYLLPEGKIQLEVETSELQVTFQEQSLHIVLSAWMTMQKNETVPLQIVMDVSWE